MTFSELRTSYSSHDLAYLPGNRVLRFQLYEPLLLDLFEDKIIYDEKFLAIVRLENLRTTPEGFNGTAVPIFCLGGHDILAVPSPTEPWKFGSTWEDLRMINNSLNAPYAGFSIWPEPDRVRAVEALACRGSWRQAWDLCANEPEVSWPKG